MSVPNTFATATSAIPLANLDANFAYYDAAYSISGSAVTFIGNITLSSGTANGVVYLNGSKVATSGTALVFDGANLGVGVTPSAWSGYKAIQVGAVTSLSDNGADITAYTLNAYNGTGGWRYGVTGIASQYYQYNGNHVWRNAPSGTAGNAITFTQAMTLDASGNLLVGKTVPTFTTDGASLSNVGSNFSYTSNTVIAVNRNGTDGAAVDFYKSGGGKVGSISVTSTATSYNTSSDYRLKDITGPITTSGAYIDSLKPVEGTWKADGSTFVGLIAHETQEVSRTTVATGTKDGDEMQGMDYSSAEIIANLIAELQSVRTRLAALEAK